MSGKPNLFEEDSDESDDVSLNINKDYAQRYEEWREAEVKRRLEDKYGNEDEASLSGSSSEDEENPEELEKALSKDFFEVISSLKTKDPRIYNPRVKFFENEKSSIPSDSCNKKAMRKKEDKSKPVYLRDYERKLIVEKGGQLSDDESDEENQRWKARASSPSYVEEQQLIKDSFKKALLDDDSEDEKEKLLKKKEKTNEEKEKEEEEYLTWLKGETENIADKEAEEKLKPLKKLWNDPKLDDDEKFLRDYVLNKRYMEKDASGDLGDLTDDEYLDEYMNEFERNYNFRFEEPDKEFLKRYPRNIEQSVRQKDTKRKERRKAVEERKKEEKKKKQEELKLLKALKRKEILKKIDKIKEITGNDDLGLQPEELEEDFDPEAHDRRMQELFNNDYYENAEDVEDVEDLNIPPLEEDQMEHDYENWDEWDGTGDEAHQHSQEAHSENTEFIMDCDYDPVADTLHKQEKSLSRKSAKEKRRLKRQSRFGRLVHREKPVFDPNDKSFEKYVDEYYGMDYEDLIGDIPCRFKYTSVVPNSFGLTVEEILAADDKELNQWASIKKTFTIRPEHVERNDAKMYQRKAQDEALKRKILPSLFKHEDESNIDVQDSKKKKKKKKEKGISFTEEGSDEMTLDSSTYKPKKRTEGPHSSSELPATSDLGEHEDSFTKKGKKRKHQDTSFIDTKAHQTAIENCVSKKKKNKSWNIGDISPPVNTVTEMSIKETSEEKVKDDLSSPTETPPQKKKKKKSKGDSTKQNDSANNSPPADSNLDVTAPSTEMILPSKKYISHQDIRRKNLKISEDSNNKNTKKRSKKHFKKQQETAGRVEYSDARLRAYGIHPKKYKRKLKYGTQNK